MIRFWMRLPPWVRWWSPWWLHHVLERERQAHNRTMAELRACEGERLYAVPEPIYKQPLEEGPD